MNTARNQRSQRIHLMLLLSLTLTLLVLPCMANNAVAATLAVDCDAGGKLQTALNTALTGDTIRVSGVCNENVSVRDELARITIDGQGAATINGPSAATAVVTVLGRNITIQ